MAFREWFIDKRKSLGMSQRVFAKKSGISYPTIVSWECGKRKAGINSWIKLSRIFKVKVDEIRKIIESN